jgi:pyruvate/2-oxoacid:ferredoxin oxidoreductase beta subunit
MIRIVSKFPEEEYFEAPHGACVGCSIPLATRYFLKAMGKKVVFVVPPGCASVIFNIPKRVIRDGNELISVLSCPFGSAATYAGGLRTGLLQRGENDTLVVAWTGDGATLDIGFGAVSAVAERNEDFIYVCYDNEAYMNTGNQRSSATPWGAITSTNPLLAPKHEHKKDIMLILSAHSIPYAATLNVAYPDDFIRKVQKAKTIRGFRYLHIFTPCPTGWRFPTNLTIKVSRLAVETKISPILEVENGRVFKINKEPDGIPLEEYTGIQGRYAHLTTEELKDLQEKVEEKWNWLKWLAGFNHMK